MLVSRSSHTRFSTLACRWIDAYGGRRRTGPSRAVTRYMYRDVIALVCQSQTVEESSV